MLVVDTSSFQPVAAGSATSLSTSAVVLSTYQGGRYHPDVIRAIAEDPQVLDTFSRAVSRQVNGQVLLIDAQEMGADDNTRFISFVRSIANTARSRGIRTGVLIPARDTVGYPSEALARVADLLVIKLAGEFGPGTRPGPSATPEFVRRVLGSRSNTIGASRVAAYFPLHGYIWFRGDSVRPVSFNEANRRVVSEAGTLQRDPSSQFLHADGREGWTLWIPDSRTVDALMQAIRSRGIQTVMLSALEGADPAIAHRYGLRR